MKLESLPGGNWKIQKYVEINQYMLVQPTGQRIIQKENKIAFEKQN